MNTFVGKKIEAITLRAHDGEFTEALTDNYQKLLLSGCHVPNRWITARVDAVEDGALRGVAI
jgi:hypothetical protein